MSGSWVYLLRCRDGSLYAGWTADLERRVASHARGTASRYTASRRPVELAWSAPMPDPTAARRTEARIKRLTRAQKLALVAGEAPLPELPPSRPGRANPRARSQPARTSK